MFHRQILAVKKHKFVTKACSEKEFNPSSFRNKPGSIVTFITITKLPKRGEVYNRPMYMERNMVKFNFISMLKIKLSLFAFVILLITACDNSNEEFEKESNSIDFKTESIELDRNLTASLGFEKLVLEKGRYSIDNCGDNFGSVSFNLKEVEKSEKSELKVKSGFGPRIRIGTRKSGCKKGIGFRCGLVKVDVSKESRSYDIDRDKLVEIDVDEEGRTLTIEFLEPVDWEKLKNE